jgi:hypothetical protein
LKIVKSFRRFAFNGRTTVHRFCGLIGDRPTKLPPLVGLESEGTANWLREENCAQVMANAMVKTH